VSVSAAYAVANYGKVKIDTHCKDVEVYIDGGYSTRTKEVKKFAL
jgi:archaellum component FlaG (FlaF/FlaG flagellin family)